MACLSCKELYDKAYIRLVVGKLTQFFADHPCVDCGETDIVVLEFSDQNVWKLIEQVTPIVKVMAAVNRSQVLCCNCLRRREVASFGLWGLR